MDPQVLAKNEGECHLQKGQQLLQMGQLVQAQEAFCKALATAESVMNAPGICCGITVRWAEVLLECGLHLNMLHAGSQAVMCFKTAAHYAALAYTERGPSLLAKSLQALVHTCVHLRDCSIAYGQVLHYEPLLQVTEEGRNALGDMLLELGEGQLEQSLSSSAMEILQQAYHLLLEKDVTGKSLSVCKVYGALGYCYLVNGDPRACDYLYEAVEKWKSINWPPEEALTILNAMKHYIESLFRNKCFDEDQVAFQDMLYLHRAYHKYGLNMQVADALTYLGTVAFHREHEQKATSYFEWSLKLYKEVPTSEENRDEIQKLLRFIGVACYNSRDFQKAARSYMECLQMLEKYHHPGNISKLGQIAECCASLGFTYSRLRDFDSMLKYYERALELEYRLAPEDLQLIETNIGSLYHVKAVKYEQQGDDLVAKKYYDLAESAFTRALRYSWKSFPYINYGYYLLCRTQYSEAANALQQGYLNGVIDKDTVEFDHTEDPILLDDLKSELEGREDIRMPAVVIALYLKTLAQVGMGNIVGAEYTAGQLEQEVNQCKYATYYVEGYGEQRMKGLSLSLLGYAFRVVGWHAQSHKAFEAAALTMPGYTAAIKNVKIQEAYLIANRHRSLHKK